MTNKPTYEQLQEQYELTVLKSASYKETLDKAHNDLAEIKAFYMREKQKRKNLEREVEKLKKELQEERIGNSQAEDEVLEMNQTEANKEFHEKRAEAAK